MQPPFLKEKAGYFQLFGCSGVLIDHFSLWISVATNTPPKRTLILFIRSSLFKKLAVFCMTTFFVVVWFLEANIVHLELNQYTTQKPPGLLQPPLNPVLFGEPLLDLLDDSPLTNNSIFCAYFGQNNFGSMVPSVHTREICLGDNFPEGELKNLTLSSGFCATGYPL